MNTCYCDGYGICFGGRQKYEDYFKMQDDRNAENEKLDKYNKRREEAEKEGKDPGFNETEKADIEELRKVIGNYDKELDTLREEAKKRGEDPKARKEETETYDSTHIWDYAPHD
jgi:cell division protein FtsB